MSSYAYILLNVFTIAGPLALSFDRRVAFFRDWRYFSFAIAVSSFLYLVWDIAFTALGIWKFNEKYLTGFNIVNLPWEEVFFFIAVPYACLFIYACLRHYFPQLENKRAGNLMSYLLILLCGVTVVLNYNKLYTAVTGILLFFTLLNQVWVTRGNYMTHLYAAWFIALLPMAVVNGFLTSLPILIYNNSENLGIRIHTLPLSNGAYGIPIEDFFYNLLYMMWMIWIYEARKNHREIHLITPVAEEDQREAESGTKH